jgi:hypothetical protein
MPQTHIEANEHFFAVFYVAKLVAVPQKAGRKFCVAEKPHLQNGSREKWNLKNIISRIASKVYSEEILIKQQLRSR